MVTAVLSKLYSSGKQRFFVYFASQLVNDGLFPFKEGYKANNSKLKPLRNNKCKKRNQ
jgi:hypothetical protein